MIEIIYVTILGLLFGSFLNVVILRIPQGQSIVFDASHCTSCNTKLKPWHNIPLLSWLFLRGKCSFCGEKISVQYPLIEFTSALLFFALFTKMGISLTTFGIAITFLALLALSVIDWKYKMVPDSINLFALTLSIVSVYSPQMFIENFKNALLFAGGFALLRFYLSYYLFVKIRHYFLSMKPSSWLYNYHPIPHNVEALGEADIMIAATMGALLGVELGLVAIFLSALLALPIMIIAKIKAKTIEDTQVAYIPFLLMATVITYFFDTPIHNYITTIYGA